MSEKQKFAIDLNLNSVTILTKEKAQNHSIVYMNSKIGRERILQQEPQEIVDEVFAVWGDTPIVEDYVPPPLPPYTPPEPTPDQFAILDLTEQTIDNDYRLSVLELGL